MKMHGNDDALAAEAKALTIVMEVVIKLRLKWVEFESDNQMLMNIISDTQNNNRNQTEIIVNAMKKMKRQFKDICFRHTKR